MVLRQIISELNRASIITERRDEREKLADEQVRRRLRTHVHVIAHLHPLGGHGHDVERPLGACEALEHGR
ncbi:unannotated protein [freshwater metagenome]|uniref:Unannotated protein n=1 Tax=freshwater metagenome TaxID=449393 RepID=A0A6J6TX44_9ZZZZ